MAVKEEISEEEIGFLRGATQTEPEEEVSRARSLIGAPLKGSGKFLTSELQKIKELIHKTPYVGEEIEASDIRAEMAGWTKPYEERMESFDKMFPTREGLLERGLERGGEMLPFVFAPEAKIQEIGSGILRSLVAGTAGEGAKDLGAPGWLQGLIELGVFAAPGLGKKIPAATADEAMEYGRARGMTEQELSLATGDQPGIGKQFLEGAAHKGKTTQKAFDATKAALDRVWQGFRGNPGMEAKMTGEQSKSLIGEMDKILNSMPDELAKRVRPDVANFASSNHTLNDAVDLWQKLNYYIRKGEGSVGLLKDPIKKTFQKVNPELAKDFELTNRLYGNFAEAAARMRPQMVESLIQAGERGMLIHGILEGNMSKLGKVLGFAGARQLASHLITNPRFARIQQRMINALNRNKPLVVKTLYDQMKMEVGKVDPEAARMMADFDISTLLEANK